MAPKGPLTLTVTLTVYPGSGDLSSAHPGPSGTPSQMGASASGASRYLDNSPDHDRLPSRSRNDKISSRLWLLRRICFSAISGWVPPVMAIAFDLAGTPHSPRYSRAFQRFTSWRSSPKIGSAARSATHPGRFVPRPRSSFVETAVRGDWRPRLGSSAAVRLTLVPRH